MTGLPINFEWDGESMVPLRRHRDECDRTYVVGETYRLVEHEQRSGPSHRHEFAWLREAWKNLPEALADLYPTVEHLRKRALIDAGYFDELMVDAGTQAAALRVAAAFRMREEFALVITRGPIVCLRTAKSQSLRAMGKQAFQESKTAILETVAALIEVSPAQLVQNADRAA